MSRIITEIICSGVILLGIAYYFRAVGKFKDSVRGQKVLASASQITFSAFIIGFAVIMILINTINISKGRFILCELYHTMFVCVVNAVSIAYYDKVTKDK